MEKLFGCESSNATNNRRQSRKMAPKGFERTASEHRSKTSLNANYHRSLSSQPDGRERNSKDKQQWPPRVEFVEQNVFEKAIMENSNFPNFFFRVNCPLCLETQNNKIELVKHLEGNCRIRKESKSKLFSTFQILPDNSIKCNVCLDERFGSPESYFLHVHNEDHIFNCSLLARAGKRLTDFLYCASCYVQVPDNFTQVHCHMQHRIHKARSTCFAPADLKNKLFISVYGIFNGKKTFRCLACPPPNFLFYTALEMIKHLKTAKHSKGMNNYTEHKIYCGFCKAEFGVYEVPFHFTSDEHVENETAATDGKFELCLYCGFSCSNLMELSHHMKLRCDEIKRIREENAPLQNPVANLEKRETEDKQRQTKKKPKEKCCILVKDEVHVVPLIKTLKTFGQIKSVGKYDHEYFLIEFKNETSVEDLCLVRNLIKVGDKKLCIRFMHEVEAE